MNSSNFKTFNISEVILQIISGVSVNGNDFKANKNEKGVLKTGCVKHGVFIPTENKRILESEIKRAKVNPLKNTIILNRSNTQELVGMVGYVKKDYKNLFLSDKLWLIQANEELVDTKYFIYLLSSSKYSKKISSYATGTSASMKNISQKAFENIQIQLPPLNIQYKVKNYLSSLDKKIQLQEEKINLLKKQKRGYVQKILKQEIRFKDEDGGEYPEWFKIQFRDLLKEINDKTNQNNQYPVISSTSRGLMYQSEYFNRQVASEDNIGYKILRKGQVVLSPQNLWLGNINTNFKYDIGIVSPSYKIFDIVEGASKYFISEVLLTPRMLYNYKISSEQGASIVRRNLNMDLFYGIELLLPIKAEQDKIAAFLSKLDDKIQNEQQKLDYLKEQKKGSMQQMFI